MSAGSPDDAPAEPLAWTGDTRWTTLDRPAGAVALLAALVALWALGGAVGALAWLAITACWLLAPPVVPVALGQFALVALTPADAGLVALLPAEGALLALLAASFLDSGAWNPGNATDVVGLRPNLVDALAYAGVAVALSAGVVYAWELAGPLVAGGLCLAVVAAIGYGLRPVTTG
ncbi:hypothetical protein [Haloarcula onubensis]|uniref:DUF8163 domain-containing protein n=1 Tax=Haloarcula onubensis TaxID=2950539 RepID=A0ABU2FJ87_9EURY|nr:hypothetical protein [Halomicroarcula sp. S3CR25-11]MDS0280797.1 hypothetical protein [Halomicroarcula sp. S3CR25-11]